MVGSGDPLADWRQGEEHASGGARVARLTNPAGRRPKTSSMLVEAVVRMEPVVLYALAVGGTFV